MTEHKFTDEEVIKALECCCKDNYEGDCPKCPLQLNGNCNVILAEHALDLINRQKEEIERLIENFQRSIRADAKAGMSAGEILLHINNMLVELKKKYTEGKE